MLINIARLAAKQLATAILIGSSTLLCSISASAQEIAFAFSNTLSPSTGLDGMARTKMLVNSLKRVDVVQSMFLIRTATINAKTIERMAFYEEAGQLLVNAGVINSPLSRKSQDHLQADIAKANIILGQYTNYHKHIYFPYLYEGGDRNILSSLQQYLTEHNYQPSYTTYQTRDDYLDQLYQTQLAAGKSVDLASLENVYINILLDDISAYSTQALLLLGYYPRQVILLHETDLTAYSMVGLVDALTEKGFHIISPEKIFSDPVANPFFTAGYTATGYMHSITGLVEPQRSNSFLPSAAEKKRIHQYLIAHGLGTLIER